MLQIQPFWFLREISWVLRRYQEGWTIPTVRIPMSQETHLLVSILLLIFDQPHSGRTWVGSPCICTTQPSVMDPQETPMLVFEFHLLHQYPGLQSPATSADQNSDFCPLSETAMLCRIPHLYVCQGNCPQSEVRVIMELTSWSYFEILSEITALYCWPLDETSCPKYFVQFYKCLQQIN